MLTYIQALLLGALQGVTELFPISSLGHSVIVPSLLGWQIDQQDPHFLLFLVSTHAATALVLFLFFWRDWKRIFQGLWRSLRTREIRESDADAKLGWLLIISTIPAGVLGLLFQDEIQKYFLMPTLAASFLILNGVLLLLAEGLRRRASRGGANGDTQIARLSYKKGLTVGVMQSLALMPGFSRTGSALSGGLLVGLSHEDAVRFSFLLATPIIGAAAVLKMPELFVGYQSAATGPILLGSACAAVCAFLSVRFLTRYFQLENRTLRPFALYCLIAGAGALFMLW